MNDESKLCRDDSKSIHAIIKWIDAVTEELRAVPSISHEASVALWNIRAELHNEIRNNK